MKRTLVLFVALAGLTPALAAAQEASDDGEDGPANEPLPELQRRFRLEMMIGGERHIGSFVATGFGGSGEATIALRRWTGGVDVCPAFIVRPYLDLGACLGLHVGSAQVPYDETQFYGDTSPSFMGRVALRATFRAPAWLRGGVDLMYRAYVSQGREAALEAGARVGVDIVRRSSLDFFVELLFRAPLVVTRSQSTYGWPLWSGNLPYPTDDDSEVIGHDVQPTRDLRVFTLGLQVGVYWSIP